MNECINNIQNGIQWSMLFAQVIVLIAENPNKRSQTKSLNHGEALKSNGLRKSRSNQKSYRL